MGEEFIGAGWGFPVSTTPRGSIALVEGTEEIEQAMRLILSTAYGERPMRPMFGCGIHDHLFSPADATTAGILAYEVRYSLERWEPRIEVVNIDVTIDASMPGLLYIDIHYVKRGTNDPRNLVFPFYTISEEH